MKHFIYILLVSGLLTACKKAEFLDKLPDQSLVVPSTLEDFQAILDHSNHFNTGSLGIVPGMGEIASDNYYLTSSLYMNTPPLFQRYYTWTQDLYEGEDVNDWNITYRAVYFCNIVLDGLPKLTVSPSQQDAFNNVKGTALFHRAHCFYQLAQVFAPFYTGNNGSAWGIPLRGGSDVSEKISRAPLKETYDRILEDLITARTLLPATSAYKTRPSQLTVDALLARIYLTMRDYDKSLIHANSALAVNNALLDYNDPVVRPGMFPPFPNWKNNPEVIFQCNMYDGVISPIVLGNNIIDSTLYNSYDPNDLRKTAFYYNFSGVWIWIGSYAGQNTEFFSGLATDELYLTRAECNARKGNKDTALADLNKLMKARWKNTVTYIPITAATPQEALQKILIERRKELCFRGLRWTDLRRLNSEDANITLKRVVNGQTHTLPPNDNRWTYPIPDPVIQYNPGMPNNPR